MDALKLQTANKHTAVSNTACPVDCVKPMDVIVFSICCKPTLMGFCGLDETRTRDPLRDRQVF